MRRVPRALLGGRQRADRARRDPAARPLTRRYEISFAAGAAALRVDHRLDGPVKCRAEPAAQKQVFSDTPVELYTQAVDEETHNIVQLYFSDLRDEVAVDVLNLTGTDVSLEDAECITFDADATGAALNYKIIVRDGRVVAVLYQEGGEVRAVVQMLYKKDDAAFDAADREAVHAKRDAILERCGEVVLHKLVQQITDAAAGAGAHDA